MKKLVTVLFITLLFILIILGIIYFAKSTFSKAKKEPVVVRIEKPTQGQLIEYINAPGEVRPQKKVDISAKIAARIMELPLKEGMQAIKGDDDNPPSVLVKLDASDLEASLKSAQAQFDARKTQIELSKLEVESQQASINATMASYVQAQRDLDRQKALLATKDVSQSVVDQAQSTYDQLKANLEAAQNGLQRAKLQIQVSEHNLEEAAANITRAKEDLSYTIINSPIDGTITRLNAEVGELVMTGTMNNAGTVILTVADLSTMLLVAEIDEININRVKVGQNARVNIHAMPEQVFDGTVKSIALSNSLSSSGAKFFETKILIDIKDQRILTGLTADVDIEVGLYDNIIKISSQAVLERRVENLPFDVRENSEIIDKKKTFVAVVYRYIDGKAIVTPVNIGPSDATHTIIKNGLALDDQVIVGPFKVLEGVKHQQEVEDETLTKRSQEVEEDMGLVQERKFD